MNGTIGKIRFEISFASPYSIFNYLLLRLYKIKDNDKKGATV
jgi:hypothetical protein